MSAHALKAVAANAMAMYLAVNWTTYLRRHFM
jgi:hypothetical protein